MMIVISLKYRVLNYVQVYIKLPRKRSVLVVYKYTGGQVLLHNYENEINTHTPRLVFMTNVRISDCLRNSVTFPIYSPEHITYLIRFSRKSTKKKSM
jgi:hypothetical protein